MKRMCARPRLAGIVLSIFLISLFFLPLVTATENGGLYFDVAVGQDELNRMGLDSHTVKNMSLFSYTMLFINHPEELHDEGHIGAIIFGSIGVISLLVLLCAATYHPLLMLLFSALTGLAFFLTGAAVPNDLNGLFVWGFSHYAYWPTIALLAACSIWLFICKRRWENSPMRKRAIFY